MKQVLITLLLCSVWQPLLAQLTPIEVSTLGTTSIQFHRSIRHVDIGSANLLVQPVAAADSILLVKAGNVDFTPTNITVITSDGALHIFQVCYTITPAQWTYSIPSIASPHPRQIAELLLLRERFIRNIHTRTSDMIARVDGIYVKGDFLYLVLQLSNAGAFRYDIDGFRVYCRDRKKVKRVAVQEQLLLPALIAGDSGAVGPYSKGKLVIVLDRMTLPAAQVLDIECSERKGGRHLRLRIRPKQLLHAILCD